MSKKILYVILFMSLGTIPAFAQFTRVSGTVQDSNGIPYAGGSISAVLVPGTPGGWRLSGQPYAGRLPNTALDSTGSFTVQMGDNNSITPAGTQWLFTVNSNPGGILPPLGTGSQSFTATITITGATQSISVTLQAAAPALSVIRVGIGGSVGLNQVAVGTAPNTIGGGNGLTFDVGANLFAVGFSGGSSPGVLRLYDTGVGSAPINFSASPGQNPNTLAFPAVQGTNGKVLSIASTLGIVSTLGWVTGLPPGSTVSASNLTLPGALTSSIDNTNCYTVNGVAYSNVQTAATAAGTNGLTCVPTNYVGVDVPAGTQIQNLTIPTSSSQPAGTHIVDYRFGAQSESFFNPPFNQFANFSFAKTTLCNLTATLASPPTSAYCYGLMQNVYDGGSNYSGNKSNYATLPVFHNGWTQGQHQAINAVSNCYGAGDCVGVTSITESWGGSNSPSDEGVLQGDTSISQGHVAAVGSITSGAATGATSLVLAFSVGDKTQGAGRYLIDTTLGTSTGNVTTIAGSGPLIYTFSGTAFTVDTVTTDSTVITVGSQAVTTVAATTGIVANTTLVCIADTAEFECVIPTVVAANSITATFRKPHPSGAKVSWGGEAGQLIELNADRWTATGAIGYVSVTNTLRFAWPVIGCTSGTVCQVWNSVGGNYQPYTGRAKISAATNSYTIYPGAEILSVQSGGTVSNTTTLAPNNAAWVNAHAIEVPLYPGQKMTFQNVQINRFSPSPGQAGSGAGITFNGTFCCGDSFNQVTFNPTANTDYAGHGGNMQAPLSVYQYSGPGPVRYGLQFYPVPPDVAVVTAACPLNSSGVTDCTGTNIFTAGPKVLEMTGASGNDWLHHDPGNNRWVFSEQSGTFHVAIPATVNGASQEVGAPNGAMDLPVEVGYVSCTQVNCATSATTLFTAPAANVLLKVDAAVACTSATATATAVLTITYTDVSNTAETIVTGAAACTTLGAASQVSLSQPFMVKASTVIQYNLTNANSPLYQARVAIFQESAN